MKKFKLFFTATALLSVFTFSSCLDDNSDEPIQYMSLVTIDRSLGCMYPDENPNQEFYFSAGDLSQYGISAKATRALINYTVPTVIDWTAPSVNITLLRNQCQDWPVMQITDEQHADTCSTYTSAFKGFTQYGVGNVIFPALNVVRNRYMNVGYSYRANKIGRMAMVPNRVSNDTVYFDFKLKKEGANLDSGAMMNSFDLSSAFHWLAKATPKNDSLYVTVVALTGEKSDYIEEKMDSVTTRLKDVY